jgi:hypothetical protein
MLHLSCVNVSDERAEQHKRVQCSIFLRIRFCHHRRRLHVCYNIYVYNCSYVLNNNYNFFLYIFYLRLRKTVCAFPFVVVVVVVVVVAIIYVF